MSLLRDIQDSAISSDSDLASLLRKCKVLAFRLGSDEFKTWVDAELSGYKSSENLPSYRVFKASTFGNFHCEIGHDKEELSIPSKSIPAEYREFLSTVYMMESIASINTLIQGSTGEPTREIWDLNIVASIGQDIYIGKQCLQAWKAIPLNILVSITDEVRNRILNFVLEVESQNPEAGEADINSAPLPTEKVSQIFNTYISGTVGNVATGSHSFEQHAVTNENSAEVFNQLIDALQTLQQPELTQPIVSNIKEMQATQGTENFKLHYQGFMSLLADHMTVLSPVVTPYLPALSALLL